MNMGVQLCKASEIPHPDASLLQKGKQIDMANGGVHSGKGKHQTVEPVQNSAVTRHDVAVVLDAVFPLNGGSGQIPQHSDGGINGG